MFYQFNHTLIFPRLLKAGRAKVYRCPLPSHSSLTHVMAKPITEDSKSHNAPCYPVSHIVQHLFGVSKINYFNILYICIHVVTTGQF